MQKQLFSIFEANKYLVLLLIILSNFLMAYITNEYLNTVDLFYNTYSDRTSMEDATRIFTNRSKMNWIGYVGAPLLLLGKFLLISFGINMLMLLLNIKLNFKKIFGIVMVAELVFVLSNIVRVIWLLYFKDVQTMNDLDFVPLSLYSLLGGKASLPQLLQYPSRFFNLFEVAYWIFLAIGLAGFLHTKLRKSLGMVAGSYGVGLLVYLAAVSMGTGIYKSTNSEDKFAERRQHPPQEIINTIAKQQPEDGAALNSQPIILYFFGAGCGQCEKETQDMVDNMELLKNARILMITPSTAEEFQEFNKKFDLGQYPNVNVARDESKKVMLSYGVERVPHLFLYDKEHELVRAVSGKLKPQAIAEALQLNADQLAEKKEEE